MRHEYAGDSMTGFGGTGNVVSEAPRRWNARLTITAMIVTLGLAAAVAPSGPARAAEPDELHSLVNQSRAAEGKPALGRNPAMDDVALAWAQHMAQTGVLSHNPDYSRQIPAGWLRAGENVATGHRTTAEMHRAWMASPGHRANILGDYTDIGIAFVSANGSTWGVEVFAKYRTDNPAPNVDPEVLESFVERAYQDFLGRPPTQAEKDSWLPALKSGQVTRYEFAVSLSQTDEWLTVVITHYYRDTLDRAPDPVGLRHWIDAARNGMPVAQIAAAFYASPEYYQTKGGNSDRIWVTDLYAKLLLREPDPQGLTHWMNALAQGMSRDHLAFIFYQSPESLSVRVDQLYRKFLGRPAEPGGIESWSPFVYAHGDLYLAAALVASDEYLYR